MATLYAKIFAALTLDEKASAAIYVDNSDVLRLSPDDLRNIASILEHHGEAGDGSEPEVLTHAALMDELRRRERQVAEQKSTIEALLDATHKVDLAALRGLAAYLRKTGTSGDRIVASTILIAIGDEHVAS